MSSDQVSGEKEVKSLNGKQVKLSANGGKLQAAGADVIEKDLTAKNGVVHVVSSCVNETKSKRIEY